MCLAHFLVPFLRTFYTKYSLNYWSKFRGALRGGALKLIDEGLLNYEKHYGKDHLRTAEPIRYLGEIYFAKGDLDKAETLFNQALKILENYANHPDRHWVFEKLAELYHLKSNQDDKALKKTYRNKSIKYLEQALSIATDNFPKDSVHIERIKKGLQKLKQK